MIGTPSYMSPEQARGSKDVDGRSDLFALGSVLFCCASQRPPFVEADSLETLFKLTTETAPPLDRFAPTMPPRLVRLVQSLLSLEPIDRPPSARAVRDELAAMSSAGEQDLSNEPTIAAAPVGVGPTIVSEPMTVPAATIRLPTAVADTTVKADRAPIRGESVGRRPETTLDEHKPRKLPLWALFIVIPLGLAVIAIVLKLTLRR